jgi:hypothetical protein
MSYNECALKSMSDAIHAGVSQCDPILGRGQPVADPNSTGSTICSGEPPARPYELSHIAVPLSYGLP